jgi:stage II sporulation protein AA (anti-sigma F factor antagonist)
MNPSFELQRNYLIIRVRGELDHCMADQIRLKSDTYLEGTRIRHVIFDFQGATFMDSSGIGVIMGRYKQVRRMNGKLYAVNMNDAILRIVKLSGLHKLIEPAESVEAILCQE